MARLVPAAFSILTWNIYFAPNQWAIRMRHILAECERLQPDVLCLQEVLPPFLALLQDEEKTTELMSSFTNDDNDSGRNSWLARNDYMCSTLDSAEVAPYGVLTMVKRKHRPRFQSLDLPSRMGRRLLLTHLECEGWGVEGGEGGRKEGVIEEWTIGNVHLESLDSVGLRVEQLRKAGVSLSVEGDRIKNVVLCGDFNFCSERNYDIHDSSQSLEDDVLPLALPYFQDLWPLMKKGTKEEKEGFTFDGTRNTLIRMPRPDPQMRYDRVLWRGAGRKEQQQQQQQQETQQLQEQEQGQKIGSMAEVAGRGWRPRDTRLVGTEPVKESLFLSDHFGLLATFEKEQ